MWTDGNAVLFVYRDQSGGLMLMLFCLFTEISQVACAMTMKLVCYVGRQSVRAPLSHHPWATLENPQSLVQVTR